MDDFHVNTAGITDVDDSFIGALFVPLSCNLTAASHTFIEGRKVNPFMMHGKYRKNLIQNGLP